MDEFTHWRDSARTPKLGFLDYRLTFFFVLGLFTPAMGLGDYWVYIFGFIFVVALFFAAIEKFHFTLGITFRWLKNTVISGKFKKAKPWW